MDTALEISQGIAMSYLLLPAYDPPNIVTQK